MSGDVAAAGPTNDVQGGESGAHRPSGPPLTYFRYTADGEQVSELFVQDGEVVEHNTLSRGDAREEVRTPR